jgi:hypothetical protein
MALHSALPGETTHFRHFFERIPPKISETTPKVAKMG